MTARSLNTSFHWLALYFVLNLSLTLYNKSVLIHFPFPYTLTAIHALCGSIGTWLLLRYQHRRRSQKDDDDRRPGPGVPRLNTKEYIVLFLFSILYTINIVVSNASLKLVTVPFHQVVRAATPFFTLLFSAIILRNNFKCTTRKALSLVPVVAGVGFATYGDYYFTTLGFLLTLLGTVLAALKTIITHLILIKPAPSTLPQEPTLPLYSPLGCSTVPLPPSSSEKDSVYYRHRTPLTIPPPIETGNNDSLLLSASQYPPSPYSPPAYYPSLPSSSSSSHLLTPSPTSPSKGHGYGSPSPPPPPPTLQSKIPKLKLSPLHLLHLLSPLAFIQTTLLAHWTGELERVAIYLATLNNASSADAAIAISGAGGYLTRIGEWIHLSGLGGFQPSSLSDLNPITTTTHHIHIHPSAGPWSTLDPRIWLLLNGIMAFLLNVVSFHANRRVGALGMTVAANVKQVLTILLAVMIFDLTITPANAVGVALTILGGAGYAVVELAEKRARVVVEKGGRAQ